MESSLSLAEKIYGTCSNQYLTILRAWEQICVETGHRMVDPELPCISIANAGLTTICEENNQFTMCLSGSIPDIQHGRWRIIGKNSTSFSSIHGMQGNSQYGSSCLDVIQIPSMPFYPQEVTITYWHPELGETLSKKVLINDCTGDKPSCEEFHENLGMELNENQHHLSETEVDFTLFELMEQAKAGELNLMIYDLMGNIISNGYAEYLNISPNRHTQILIFTFWDKNGYLVKTKKSFVGH